MLLRFLPLLIINLLVLSPAWSQPAKMVKDANPGGGWGAIWNTRMVRFGNAIYFMGDDGVHGSELWKSNGTAIGTVMVKDINPGKESSRPSRLMVATNQLFFVADDGVHGQELWRTDGTAAGTRLVKELTPGNNEESAISYESLGTVGSTLLFGFVQNYENRLWLSDGTAAGTLMLKNLEPGLGVSGYINYKGRLYFSANDGVHGKELWQSDGTVAGTTLTKDLTPGEVGTVISDMIVFQAKLYFFADTTYQNNAKGKPHGSGLWQSDGTATGTGQVYDIKPAVKALYNVQNLTRAGDRLYFHLIKQTQVTTTEIWKSDGTAGGTGLVKAIDKAGVYALAPLGNSVLFTAKDPAHGMQLWKSDGTPAGTGLLKSIADSKSGFGIGFDLGVIKSTLFFSADDGVHGIELWQTDGTPAGTKLSQDIDPGNPPQPRITPTSQPTHGLVKLTRQPVPNPKQFRVLSTDGLYFIADDGVHGRELYRIPYNSVK